MASRVIVAEKQARAINEIKEHADALSASLGIDTSGYFQPVKGDAPYQEMIRSEQLAALLKAVREKVVKPTRKAHETTDAKSKVGKAG